MQSTTGRESPLRTTHFTLDIMRVNGQTYYTLATVGKGVNIQDVVESLKDTREHLLKKEDGLVIYLRGQTGDPSIN